MNYNSFGLFHILNIDALFGEGGLDAIMKEVTVGINNEKPMGKKPVSKEPKEPAAKKSNMIETLLGEGGLDALIKEVTVKLEEEPVEKKEATNKPTPVVKESIEQKEEPAPAQKPDEKAEGEGNVVLKNIVEIMPHADLASDSEKSTD